MKNHFFLILFFLLSSAIAESPKVSAIVSSPVTQNPLWLKSIDLTSKQQFQAALEPLQELKKKVLLDKSDPMGVALILAQEAKYKFALHGVETGLRDLKNETWPEDLSAKLLLEMVYSQSLVRYYEYYSYEIQQRTKTDTKDIGLKEMTSEQIFADGFKHLMNMWSERQKLFNFPKSYYSEYVSPNNFPDEIKGSFYDSYIELIKIILADTRGWSAEQSNEVFQLKVSQLVAGGKVDLQSSKTHPLEKLAFILRDQTDRHTQLGQKGATLQSRLELYEILFRHLTSTAARQEIMNELEKSLNQATKDPWYSMGLATKADFTRQLAGTTNLVEAKKIAELGAQSYPTSLGAKRCRDIINDITTPRLQLEGMTVDGVGRTQSLGLDFANIRNVSFQAFQFDVQKYLLKNRDYNILPSYSEVQAIISSTPTAQWKIELPETKDFKNHQFFTNLPKLKKGTYIILASKSATTSSGSELLRSAIFLTVSDLVLSYHQVEGSNLEVLVRQGANGVAVNGVQVELYKMDYQKGPQLIATKITNQNGILNFTRPHSSGYEDFLLVAKKDEDLLFSSNGIYISEQPPKNTASSPLFIYSDRSIYRPEQKILWKAVSFTGDSEKGHFTSRKGDQLSIELRDPNGLVVETKKLNTDEFGSGFGEFTIPRGKLLGNWTLASSDWRVAIPIKVEEYKRPTFEVKVAEAKEPLRLNHQANLMGDAKYYFGMPVTKGKVKYRIYRSGVLPWWSHWCFWDWGFFTKEQLAESGLTELNAAGEYHIQFLPKADPNLEKKANGQINNDLSYNYRLEIDLTDEGGETRTAQRNFNIGFVTVRASINIDQGFVRENQNFAATISRTDLSGTSRPGEGEWSIAPLIEPTKIINPAEVKLPSDYLQFSDKLRIPSDDEMPRYRVHYDWELYVQNWKMGALVKSGKGKITDLTLDGLSAGIYRLIYKTKDDFGSPIETSKSLLVAGTKSQFKLPLFLALEKSSVSVGGKIRVFVNTGWDDQPIVFEHFFTSKRLEQKVVTHGQILEYEAKSSERGGSSFLINYLRDYQALALNQNLIVPWEDRELKLQWSSFRDKIRPGDTETWELSIQGHDKKKLQANAAQVLSYMYDKSLDFFTPHNPMNPLSVFPIYSYPPAYSVLVGQAQNAPVQSNYYRGHEFMGFAYDRAVFEFNYGIGGPGQRGRGHYFGNALGRMESAKEGIMMKAAGGGAKDMLAAPGAPVAMEADKKKDARLDSPSAVPPEAKERSKTAINSDAPLRANFQETAYWLPREVTNKNGSVTVKFTVPDSLTAWNVWAIAITQDLRSGMLNQSSQTIKELMVRPYLPRFLREGDQVDIKIVVNNSSDKIQTGELKFSILDSTTKKDLSSTYNLKLSDTKFTTKAKGSTNITASIKVPDQVGSVVIEVVAKSTTGFSDGEKRELPVIPGRIHLAQSRFKILKDKSSQTLNFQDLKDNKDSSRINEQMVVTLDAQLFYSVLSALPYLINYPYECIEQTLNRFVSTGILTSIFTQFPSVAKMAKEFSSRKTPLEAWGADDPNRKISLEETPWLQESRGHLPGSEGKDPNLIAVLDPKIANAAKDDALDKLQKAQTGLGAFPWFPGGPPSPYMTLYTLYGLSKAIEFGVDVPKPMVQKAWSYLKLHYIQDILPIAISHNCCWEEITFLNYVLSNYKDNSWGNDVFTAADRQQMLDFSFNHWKQHSPYLKGYLSLTLQRMNRREDAQLVWASVMDSAKTSEDEGTHWAAEDRSWLWYNDTIETHAFALRTEMELNTAPQKIDGLVLWLFLNKKLNHWKSTRATAEVIYSLTHYLKKNSQLGVREAAKVSVNDLVKEYEFLPDSYTGKKNQIVVPGDKITPATNVRVDKSTPGYMFASATWHFSTTEVPTESRGDFLQVERKYFKRDVIKGEMTLKPLADLKTPLLVGDEVEVQISIKSKHAMEYVHLRDPRPAGFEPTTFTSGHKWDLGLVWFEEIRDTATNFFFENIPQGQYTFKYRIRAANSGEFTAAPSTISPMYAPEFTAYSAGEKIRVQ